MMRATVPVPADEARRLAALLRAHREGALGRADAEAAADLLDPPPPTLREAVAAAAVGGDLRETRLFLAGAPQSDYWRAADDMLAVVRERIEALRPADVHSLTIAAVTPASVFDSILALLEEGGA